MKQPIILISATVFLAVVVFFAGVLSSAPQTDLPPAEISFPAPPGEPAVQIIEFMSDNLYDRVGFSYREICAARWIYDELRGLGFEDIFIQDFALRDVRADWPLPMAVALNWLNASPFANLGLRADRSSQNVVLTLPGRSERTIIIGAHYDSIFVPGASDNASGVALLMENAMRMREIGHYYTLIYVFFGAEELGLYGAWYFARNFENHDNVIFMVNADVLIEGPYLFYMAAYDSDAVDCPEENWRRISHGFVRMVDEDFNIVQFSPGLNHITDTFDRVAEDIYAKHGITLNPAPMGAFGPSDQLAFLPFGYPVMFLNGIVVTNEWEAQLGYEDWLSFMHLFQGMMRVLHTPEDNFQYIEENWPGKMDDVMRGFVLFLEAVLLADYGGTR